MWLTQARLILPDKIQEGSLQMEGGCIRKFSRSRGNHAGPSHSLQGGYLAPGFIDLHIHGALGCDVMEATDSAWQTITEFHLLGGTTSMALTTVTAPESAILGVLRKATPLLNRSYGAGCRVVGVHVEGPFISPEKPGVQDLSNIRLPTAREWKKYLAFGPTVAQMTLAPERAGALELIRALRKNKSIVSAGHTNALEPEIKRALESGLNQTTHTFNCMSVATKQGHFRVPGMTEMALVDDRITCELIADGEHVAPTLMKLLFKTKGADRISLITDAMAGAGRPVGFRYHAGGPESPLAKVTRTAALMVEGASLAGSTLTMIEAVRRAVQLAEIPLSSAVRMASLNPARQLGREKEFGSLAVGKRADLVWFDEKFRVQGVWVDGNLKFLG